MNEYFVLNIDHTFGLQTETIHPVLLRDEQDLILIDCGYPHFLAQLKVAAEEKGVDLDTLTKVIITHHDHDHIGALREIREAYPNIEIYASEEQAPYIRGEKKSLRLLQAEAGYDSLPENEKEEAKLLMRMFEAVESAPVDCILEYEEPYPWCGGVQIIPTPGHMPGHISVYLEAFKTLVSGDAIVLRKDRLSYSDPSFSLDHEAAKGAVKAFLDLDIETIACYHGGAYHSNTIRDELIALSKEDEAAGTV